MRRSWLSSASQFCQLLPHFDPLPVADEQVEVQQFEQSQFDLERDALVHLGVAQFVPELQAQVPQPLDGQLVLLRRELDRHLVEGSLQNDQVVEEDVGLIVDEEVRGVVFEGNAAAPRVQVPPGLQVVLRDEVLDGGDVLDGAGDLLLRDEAYDAGQASIFEAVGLSGEIAEDLLEVHSDFVALSGLRLFQSILRHYPFPLALDGLRLQVLSRLPHQSFAPVSMHSLAHFIIDYNSCYLAIRFLFISGNTPASSIRSPRPFPCQWRLRGWPGGAQCRKQSQLKIDKHEMMKRIQISGGSRWRERGRGVEWLSSEVGCRGQMARQLPVEGVGQCILK